MQSLSLRIILMMTTLLLATLAACASSTLPADNDAEASTSPNDSTQATDAPQALQATLAIGDRAVLAGGLVTVELVAVSDSRCPRDVECVWAGEAIAEVRTSRDEGEEGLLRLSTQRGKNEAQVGDHALILASVEPYPESAGSIDEADYRVEFQLEVRQADSEPGDSR